MIAVTSTRHDARRTPVVEGDVADGVLGDLVWRGVVRAAADVGLAPLQDQRRSPRLRVLRDRQLLRAVASRRKVDGERRELRGAGVLRGSVEAVHLEPILTSPRDQREPQAALRNVPAGIREDDLVPALREAADRDDWPVDVCDLVLHHEFAARPTVADPPLPVVLPPPESRSRL